MYEEDPGDEVVKSLKKSKISNTKWLPELLLNKVCVKKLNKN
jgi:hypothetical protein